MSLLASLRGLRARRASVFSSFLPVAADPVRRAALAAVEKLEERRLFSVVGKWALNEGTGTTTADASGNSNTGTLVNGATWVAGHSGNAVSLLASSQQYVSVATDPTLNPTAAVTASAWVNAVNFNNGRHILQKSRDSDYQYRLYVSSGKLVFDVNGPGQVSTALPSTGAWHLVTGTYDGSQLRLYIDGVLQAAQAGTGDIYSFPGALSIGGQPNSTNAGDYFRGTIDDVEIDNTALSDAAVATLGGTTAATLSLSGTPSSTTQVNLAWTDTAAGDTSFDVEKSTDGVTFTTIATGLSSTARTYSATGLSADTNYVFRLKAHSSGGTRYANTASALTFTVAPASLSATVISATEVDLSWSAVTGAASYRVQRKMPGGSYVQVATVTGTTYNDASLGGGNTHVYRVLGINANGFLGDPSPTQTVSNVPVAPQNFTTLPLSETDIALSWLNSQGATSYQITRSEGGGSPTAIATVAPADDNGTGYTDKTAVAGHSYTYAVEATGGTGTSVDSSAAAAAPDPGTDREWTLNLGTPPGYSDSGATGFADGTSSGTLSILGHPVWATSEVAAVFEGITGGAISVFDDSPTLTHTFGDGAFAVRTDNDNGDADNALNYDSNSKRFDGYIGLEDKYGHGADDDFNDYFWRVWAHEIYPDDSAGNGQTEASFSHSGRVDIHGVPLPDPSPTGESENDRIPNAAYIDAYTLTPSLSTTDVAVPMPGGEMTMEFRRTLGIDSEVTHPDAPDLDTKWASETILGAGWNTNIGSRAIFTKNLDPSPTEPQKKITVIDDVGNAQTYDWSDGLEKFLPDVTQSYSNKAMRGTLDLYTFADSDIDSGVSDGLVYTGTYGTKLYYQYTASTPRLDSQGRGSTEFYFRLVKEVDRNGNEMRYVYGEADPTLVTEVYDPSRGDATTSDRRIDFTYWHNDDSTVYRLSTVTDPLSHVYTYHYTSDGDMLLSSVDKPEVADPTSGTMTSPSIDFTYQTTSAAARMMSTDGGATSYDSGSNIRWILPQTITDADGATTTLGYSFRWEPTSVGRQNDTGVAYWEIKAQVGTMTTPDGTATVTEVSANHLSKVNRFTDTRGVATTYGFTGSVVTAPTALGFAIAITQMTRSVPVVSVDGGSPVTETVTYHYSGGMDGNLTSVTDVSGNTIQYDYDSHDSTDLFNATPDGLGYGTYYTIFGKPAQRIVDPGTGHLNLATEYEYDTTFRKLVKETEPSQNVTQYSLDSEGNRVTMTQAPGTINATTHYTFNSVGFMTSMTDPDGRETDYVPNVYGNLEYTIVKGTSFEDLLDGTSPFPSIDTGNNWIVTERVAGVMDLPSATFDARGNETDYTYDNWNRQLTQTVNGLIDPSWDPLTGGTPPTVNATESKVYDFNSNLVKDTDYDGNVTVNTYDAMNRLTATRRRMDDPDANHDDDDLITQYAYDAVGDQTGITDPKGNTTTTTYDALLRKIKIRQPNMTVDVDPTSTDVDPATTTTHYTTKLYYGPNAGSGAFTLLGFNPTRVIDARGFATDNVYDAAYRDIRTIKRKDSGSGVATTDARRLTEEETDTAYNPDGKPVQVKQEPDDAARRVTVTYYDDMDRPTVSIAGALNTIGTTYDPTNYHLNGDIDFLEPSGLITRTQYDLAGHVDETVDPNGIITNYVHDGAGRQVEKQIVGDDLQLYLPTGGGYSTPTSLSTFTKYDANGNAVLMTDANGNVTQMAYDAANRPIRTTLDFNADTSYDAVPGGDDIVTLSGYDALGNKIYSIDPNGNRTDLAYDRNNRQIEVQGPEVADASAGGAMSRPETDTRYDKNGNVTGVTDPRGLVTTASYDALNRKRFSTVNSGASTGAADRLKTETRYDENGNILATVTQNWVGGVEVPQVTAYTYDPFNHKATQTQPDPGSGSPVSYFYYNELGDLVQMTDANGHSTQYGYDGAGRKVSETDADPDGPYLLTAPVTNYLLDANGNVTMITDPKGNTTSFVFNSFNKKVEQTQVVPAATWSPSETITTHYGYDADGNQTIMTDPRGNSTITEYDAANRKVQVTQPDPDGGGSLTPPTTGYTYDADGNQLTMTNPLGHVTSDEYDALNRKITETSPDPDGSGTTYTSPVTHTGYDLDGNPVTMTDALGNVTTDVYDGLNRKVTETDPDPDMVGSGAPAPVKHWSYDPAGNQISTTDPAGNVTTYDYDKLNRKVTETDPDPDGSGTAYSSPVTHWGYDPVGNQTSMTDPRGNVTTTEYDGLNRKITQKLPDPATGLTTLSSPTLHWSYDKNNNLLTSTDPLNNVTTYEYDDANRKITETDPDPDGSSTTLTAPITRFTYDEDGDLLTRTDPDANTTTYGYDALDREVSEINQVLATSSKTYDEDGNLASDTDKDGRVRKYVYDDLDRQTAEKWMSGTTVVRTIASTYDEKGRLTSVSDPDSAYAYGYDNDDRVTSIDNDGTPGAAHVVLTMAYDPAGNRTSVSSTVGGSADFVNAYLYDAMNRLSTVTQSGTGVSDKRADFAYNDDSQTSGINRYSDAAGTTPVAQSTYGYDHDSRLTGLDHASGLTAIAGYTWGFDAAGRITSYTSPDGSTTYTYDNDGQLTATDNSSLADEAYSYDENGNRTVSGYSTDDDNRLSTDGTYNYLYDGEGNRTSRTNISTGEVTHYTWDYRNRLTDVEVDDASATLLSSAHYVYDANDHRIAKQVDSDGDSLIDLEEHYVYDGDGIVLVNDGSGTITHRFLQGPQPNQVLADEDTSISSIDPTRVQWMLQDDKQTVRDVVDNTGAPLNHVVYDSYGNVLSQSDPSYSPRFQFTGMQWDAEAGLFQDYHRYYDASTGQFISQDPKSFGAGDGNLYRYVENDPIGNIDLDGYKAVYSKDDPQKNADRTAYAAYAHQQTAYYAGNAPLPEITSQVSTTLREADRAADERAQARTNAAYTYLETNGYDGSRGMAGKDLYVYQGFANEANGLANFLISSANMVSDIGPFPGFNQLLELTTGIEPLHFSKVNFSKGMFATEYNNEFSHDRSVSIAEGGWGLALAGLVPGGEAGSLDGFVAEGESLIAGEELAAELTPEAGDGEAIFGPSSEAIGTDVGAATSDAALGGQAGVAETNSAIAGNASEPSLFDPGEFNLRQDYGASPATCFVAGTPVLRGDGQEEAIDQIHVGQRVATDGGATTSGAGGTRNETDVDPKRWRLVDMVVDAPGDNGAPVVLDIQTLQPLSYLRAEHARIGANVPIPLDLKEMGVPDGAVGRIESISACPAIETGAGRVVLTTVTHLSDFVFQLSLQDAGGKSDVLQPTGWHRFYTEDRGWVASKDLHGGELVRGLHGDLTVTGVAQESAVQRVYNLTVEADHDYYVGDLTALTHNTCAQGPYSGVTPSDPLPDYMQEARDFANPEETPVGTNLTRDWGGQSGPFGQSWTTDPLVTQSRNSLGLETTNTAEFVSHGTVIDNTGITTREALPWGRFAGGGQETLVPDAGSQLQLNSVTMPDDPLPWSLPTDPNPLPTDE